MRTSRLLMLTAGIFIMTMPFLSCSSAGVEATNVFDKAQFERNRGLWRGKNIPNYKMVIGAWGFPSGYSEQVLIEVRDGAMTSMKVLWQSGGGPADDSRPFDSVEKIFDLVADQSRRAPKKFEVKYDRELGYPTSVEVDQDSDQGNEARTLVRIKSLEKIE